MKIGLKCPACDTDYWIGYDDCSGAECSRCHTYVQDKYIEPFIMAQRLLKMRKELNEKAGVDARLMTFEQLLVLIVAECGEFTVADFLTSRYEFPKFRIDEEKDCE